MDVHVGRVATNMNSYPWRTGVVKGFLTKGALSLLFRLPGGLWT